MSELPPKTIAHCLLASSFACITLGTLIMGGVVAALFVAGVYLAIVSVAYFIHCLPKL